MKKLVILLLSSVYVISSYAQLVVEESGKAAIGYTGSSTLNSSLSINSNGSNAICTYINANKSGQSYGLQINRTASTSSTSNYGLYVNSNAVSGKTNYGIYSKAYAVSSISGKSIGIYGIGGNTNTGFNYGVLGTLYGTQNGAGIYGSSTSNDAGISIPGLYAGYFRGNVFVTGTVNGVQISGSDYRLKKNIESLPSETLDDLLKMNVVKFDYKQREVETDSGKVGLYDEQSPILTHKHYGLIAQELQEIYPDLVIESDDGYLAVNYTEIIPLLIRSVQELSAKLDEANKSNALRGEGTTNIVSSDALQTELFQNTPNPFTEKTTINCTVAETIDQAILYVYDMNGKQIAEYPVYERGETQVVIEGGSLDAGMYMYSLIADGNVIDTKRMILTK